MQHQPDLMNQACASCAMAGCWARQYYDSYAVCAVCPLGLHLNSVQCESACTTKPNLDLHVVCLPWFGSLSLAPAHDPTHAPFRPTTLTTRRGLAGCTTTSTSTRSPVPIQTTARFQRWTTTRAAAAAARRSLGSPAAGLVSGDRSHTPRDHRKASCTSRCAGST